MLLKEGWIKFAYKQCSNYVNSKEEQLTTTNINAEILKNTL